MRYITHYEQYPIYEPAEGGYYYAGNQAVEYDRLSKRKAKAMIREIWNEVKDDPDEEWYISNDGNMIWKDSRYIGEGESWVIERKLGSKERGRVPYC